MKTLNRQQPIHDRLPTGCSDRASMIAKEVARHGRVNILHFARQGHTLASIQAGCAALKRQGNTIYRDGPHLRLWRSNKAFANERFDPNSIWR